jgi:hypothetical protein
VASEFLGTSSAKLAEAAGDDGGFKLPLEVENTILGLGWHGFEADRSVPGMGWLPTDD